jgi:ankyrin repeat protein
MTENNRPSRENLLEKAAIYGRIDLVKILLRECVDVNMRKENGETCFLSIVARLCGNELPRRHEVVRLLLAAGANPNIPDNDGLHAIWHAVLEMDTEMTRILLEAGADSNIAPDPDETETLYDWAEFDYRCNVHDLRLPEEPTAQDSKDEDSWLQFLDRIATKHNKRRPDYLFLLRKFGALSRREKN